MRVILDISVAHKGLKRLNATLNKSGILIIPSQVQ